MFQYVLQKSYKTLSLTFMSSSLTSLLSPRSCLFPTNIVTVSEPLKTKKQFVTTVLTNYHIVGGCIEVRVSNHDNQINQG